MPLDIIWHPEVLRMYSFWNRLDFTPRGVYNWVIFFTYFVSHFSIQFDVLHTRGSSHGGSRITRKAYDQPYYVKMMEEAFRLWSEIEQQSGKKLYQ